MKPAPFDYARPADLFEALKLLDQSDDAKLIAGGQSLGPMLNLRVAGPDLLIDVSRLHELRVVKDDPDGLTIGAAIRHAEFEDGRVPSPTNGLFQRIASDIAYRAVRNRGTVGGSLAHADPAADWPAVMLALGATLSLRSAHGDRKLAVTDLMTGALETCLERNEIIETIHIPSFSPAVRIGRCKINRKPGAFADAAAMIVIDPDRDLSRVVISGGSVLPAILRRTSEAASKLTNICDLEPVIDAELSERGLPTYQFRLFRTSVLRAAREALTR